MWGTMKIGMMFPGYGSQYVGMVKEIYDESRIMQEYFDQASLCMDINFIKLCFASSDAELSKMQNAYLSLFVVSSSLYALLAQEGIEPDTVVGYNNGLFAAMHAAKGISFADGLYIIKKLTLYAQEFLDKESCIAARIKGPSTDELSLLLKQTVQDRVYSTAFEMPNQHIIAGPEDAMHICMQQFKEMPQIKVEELSTAFAVHAGFMQPAVDAFKMYLEKVDFKDITASMISQVSGLPIAEGALLKDETMQYLTQSQLWVESLKALHTCDIVLSVGPGTLLIDMAKQWYPNKTILSVTTLAGIEEIKKLITEKRQEEAQSEQAPLEQ